ncbi:2-succinyl-5-enolpyruvyl-6-hydroxy-3-cyclohexene-1-carboxylic-acid synthase [Pseudonocardiaceae bacterium YIM PH 21723]|nr:2-succinyl-5-enolpyruvyl-6-hydroxy-3-cyclohexene-1-carboxylic-acid synthase [Pseudonocardiaceae bacterium YIM PH 21723]
MVNPVTVQTRVLVDELARGGVTEAVIAPGSRSAALAVAFAEHPDIRCHVRIDERSAAFLALGLAKAGGRPVPVVCTSGTAAANFHPAVIEADHSGIPLVVLTSDRPPELRGTGANQTMDQLKLYGDAVRYFAELGVAEHRIGQVGYWRTTICRALAAAASGPVHLNLPFREPLIPDGDEDRWLEPTTGRPEGAPWTAVLSPVEHSEPLLAEFADPVERGLVVIGDNAAEPERAVALAEAFGWPIISEATGNGRLGGNAITCYSHLLADAELLDRLRPEVIVTVGKPGLVKQLLRLYPVSHNIVVGPQTDWMDPTRTAATVVARLPRVTGRRSTGWLRSWQRLEAIARDTLDRSLDEADELSELRVARDLAVLAGEQSLIFVGSSMPIRLIDMTLPADTGTTVLTNRGVSGIDGCVSTAAGVALAHQAAGGGPAFALLGDLTLLHDQNGLLIGPHEPRPDLTIVVINNDGGGIFHLLPYNGAVDAFERLFATPHGVDLSHVAAAMGWQYELATTSAEFAAALKGGSTRLVEVRTERESSLNFLHSVREQLAAALTAEI